LIGERALIIAPETGMEFVDLLTDLEFLSRTGKKETFGIPSMLSDG
jgi:hypothetical protein